MGKVNRRGNGRVLTVVGRLQAGPTTPQGTHPAPRSSFTRAIGTLPLYDIAKHAGRETATADGCELVSEVVLPDMPRPNAAARPPHGLSTRHCRRALPPVL